jgi:antitoxin component of MazEF toxin-antitoxin module
MTASAPPDVPANRAEPEAGFMDSWIQRRIGVIWGLLFFNGLAWIGVATVVPIPQRVAQALTMGALGVALMLAVSLNRRLLIRPNLVFTLFTLLALVALVSSVRGTAGLGAVLRCFRFGAFLAVLWLLTPWWGRRDLLLLRCHLRALVAVCLTVVIGLLIAPATALGGDGRLAGALWPMWPTAVGHFAAAAAGIGIVLWLSGSMAGRQAAVLGVGGVTLALLSQTRVAMLALAAGLACAAASLFVARRRVRRAINVALIVAPAAAVALTPAISAWITRGQSAEQIRGLTGRRRVWEMLLDAPRSEFNQWFGFGFSDRSFAGLPIDNSWLAIYQDQGLLGVAIVVAIVAFLIAAAAFRPASPARALAIFLVVFAAVNSYTEVGLGDASSYLLELTVAASLLFPPVSAGGVVQGERSS